MAIILIRHGETAANAARIVQTPDAPLSPRGVEQARRLAARLARAGVGGIVSSDHPRAVDTAAIIRDATGALLDLDPELRERNYGSLRGRPYAEVGDIFAPDLEPPGGETWAAFHGRVARLWPRLVERARATPGHLAVVTHGLVLYSLSLHHLHLPPGTEPPRRWGNTSVTVVEATPPHRVCRLNCTEHLTDDTRETPEAACGT